MQTGAWLLADDEPLEPALEEFIAAGAPPVYVGFGSMPTDQNAGRTVVEAVRSVGHRVVLSRGWAELRVDSVASASSTCPSHGGFLAYRVEHASLHPMARAPSLPRSIHRRLHSGSPKGGQWNEAWRQFKEDNAGVGSQELWRFAFELMFLFNVNGPLVPYCQD
ncbi:DUF2380 domain-containing protein [Archangium sp.]|uniref:DUF2380 domain-containing protein n=1 Tax=Archangium sp. TaxID=1872627 RepID=UPI002ED85307